MQRLRSLVTALAMHIEKPADREAFVSRVIGPDVSLPPQTMKTLRSGTKLGEKGDLATGDEEAGLQAGATRASKVLRERPATPEEVAELVRVLSGYIGPVARVLVKRVQVEGMTRSQLYMKAAQAIESQPVRDQFMKAFGLYRS